LGLAKGTMSLGADGDVSVIDPERTWIFHRDQSASKSQNTPFDGWPLKGKAVATIVAGKVIWREEKACASV
jgi:dihydroorotase